MFLTSHYAPEYIYLNTYFYDFIFSHTRPTTTRHRDPRNPRAVVVLSAAARRYITGRSAKVSVQRDSSRSTKMITSETRLGLAARPSFQYPSAVIRLSRRRRSSPSSARLDDSLRFSRRFSLGSPSQRCPFSPSRQRHRQSVWVMPTDRPRPLPDCSPALHHSR